MFHANRRPHCYLLPAQAAARPADAYVPGKGMSGATARARSLVAPEPAGYLLRGTLQAHLPLLRQLFFDHFKIVQQPFADKSQEIKSEFRILEIKLAHLIIVDSAGLSSFDALDRRGSMRA